MSLLKRHAGRRRHVGRRVAGVAVGVGLMVAGLASPAYAAAPTVASFTPTSGPGGCVVQIMGDHFTDNPVLAVQFGGVNATNFQVISDDEIWATHPAGASGFVTVTSVEGAGSSASTFSNANPGGCAPTLDFHARVRAPGDSRLDHRHQPDAVQHSRRLCAIRPSPTRGAGA
jgi:hypothetical protein